MATIYLDQTNVGTGGLANALGQTLGGALGQGVTNSYTAQVLAQAKGLQPQQQQQFLVGKLGDQGQKLYEQMVQNQLDQQNLSLNKLKIVDQGFQNKVDGLTSAATPQILQLQQKQAAANVAKTAAETIAAQASAVGDRAGAAASMAQAGYYAAETERTQLETHNQLAITKAIIGMGASADPDSTATSLSNDPNVAGGATNSPAPKVPGAPPPLADPKKITDLGAMTLSLATGGMTLQQASAALPNDPPPSVANGSAKAQALGDLAQGDTGRAMDAMAKAMNPVKQEWKQFTPGYNRKLLSYQDGSTAWVGPLIDARKPAPQAIQQQAAALVAWQGTVQTLGQLAAVGQKEGAGKPSRIINSMLIKLGLSPLGPSATIANAYEAARNHAIVQAGAIERSFGGSRAQGIQQQVQDLLPTWSEAEPNAMAKIQAGGALINRQVKSLVVNTAAAGQIVPPELTDIWNKDNLGNLSDDQLAAQYLPYLPASAVGDADASAIPLDSGQQPAAQSDAGAEPTSASAAAQGAAPTYKYDAQGNLIQ
jgi:hypothetical protein